jgi:hypothetical protein
VSDASVNYDAAVVVVNIPSDLTKDIQKNSICTEILKGLVLHLISDQQLLAKVFERESPVIFQFIAAIASRAQY